MINTFRQINITQKFYYTKRNSIKYDVGGVREITKNKLTCDFCGASANYVVIDSSHFDVNRFIDRHNNYKEYDMIVFLYESEAIRYCKTNLLKELRNKIESAKRVINEVVKFRLNNIDHLNNDWIESEIMKLEKMERDTL